MIKYNNNSGAALSTGYVLDGTKVYVTGSANTGYNTVVLKKDSTDFLLSDFLEYLVHLLLTHFLQ